jgi:uracil-DNA glycosylase
MNVNVEPSWKRALAKEFSKPYFQTLTTTIREQYLAGGISPSPTQVFHAFNLCPLTSVKVVILGQDPYHGPGQAQGLSFSVPDGMNIPPSLQNIYKELASDLAKPIPSTGNLEHWATQGVLLLNATLTVKYGQPGSHQGLGWEIFTDAVIKKISDERDHAVFLLWGAYAQAKVSLIDTSKHLVLQAPHPSPFSAYKGFFGSKHFSKANEFLKSHHQTEIIW